MQPRDRFRWNATAYLRRGGGGGGAIVVALPGLVSRNERFRVSAKIQRSWPMWPGTNVSGQRVPPRSISLTSESDECSARSPGGTIC